MDKKDIEELKERVVCAAVLETAGFAIDRKESTRKAVKYRRGDDIIIVTHEGRGWFDARTDAKGDVFSLVKHLDHLAFPDALRRVADLIGFVPRGPTWARAIRAPDPDVQVADRWRLRRKPWMGSLTWRYLREQRHLAERVIRAAIRSNRLREGPRGSMWAAHSDGMGILTGWEERGPHWRGFATGGNKVLFRFGPLDARRLCVTEAAIDAMSLADIEGVRADSLYVSTGGGWAPPTEAAIRELVIRKNAILVAATDNNAQGDVFADRLLAIAVQASSSFARLRPAADDWNADLCDLRTARQETTEVNHQ